MRNLLISAAIIAFGVASCQPESTTTDPTKMVAKVTAEQILEASPSSWLTHGGDYKEQRHSKLTAVNTETIKDLGLELSLIHISEPTRPY